MRMLGLKAFRVRACMKFFLGVTLASLLTSAASAQDSTLKCMEGVYLLEEHKRDGEVFKPPQVSGRYVILDGAVLWIFHDRTQPSKQTSWVGFGRYTIDGTSFAYRYDEFEVYTQTDAGISVSRKPPWESMRSYSPVPGAGQVRLQHAESKTDFVCSADGLTAGVGQGVYRKYRRIRKE
jgi:opacity protein-like surface antigen